MKASIPIYLAVEDSLSEWVLRRALNDRNVAYDIGSVFTRGGFGYLKKQTLAFNNAAKSCPFLMLADLDRLACPLELIQQWLGRPKHPHFLLRVAVREVESWLLGDIEGFVQFLGLKTAAIIKNPEILQDPKDELLKLALRAPNRNVRDALVWKDPQSGRLHQGPDYNGTLAGFVQRNWNINKARKACTSLNRMFCALDRFEKAFRHG